MFFLDFHLVFEPGGLQYRSGRGCWDNNPCDADLLRLHDNPRAGQTASFFRGLFYLWVAGVLYIARDFRGFDSECAGQHRALIGQVPSGGATMEFRLPELGEGVYEAELVSWLVKGRRTGLKAAGQKPHGGDDRTRPRMEVAGPVRGRPSPGCRPSRAR